MSERPLSGGERDALAWLYDDPTDWLALRYSHGETVAEDLVQRGYATRQPDRARRGRVWYRITRQGAMALLRASL